MWTRQSERDFWSHETADCDSFKIMNISVIMKTGCTQSFKLREFSKLLSNICIASTSHESASLLPRASRNSRTENLAGVKTIFKHTFSMHERTWRFTRLKIHLGEKEISSSRVEKLKCYVTAEQLLLQQRSGKFDDTFLCIRSCSDFDTSLWISPLSDAKIRQFHCGWLWRNFRTWPQFRFQSPPTLTSSSRVFSSCWYRNDSLHKQFEI